MTLLHSVSQSMPVMIPISAAYGVMKYKISSMASHTYTLLDVHKDIQTGYKLSCALAVAKRIGISDQQLADVLGISIRTLQRIPDQGSMLSPHMSDRLYRLAHVIALAEYVWENEDSAHRWLHEPQRGLGGAVPLELLASQAGFNEVENLLGCIEYGLYV